MTGDADDVAALADARTTVLEKPFDNRMLLQALRELLDAREHPPLQEQP